MSVRESAGGMQEGGECLDPLATRGARCTLQPRRRLRREEALGRAARAQVQRVPVCIHHVPQPRRLARRPRRPHCRA